MKLKLFFILITYLFWSFATQAFDIRKVNNAKTFSKATYEINDTNLVDEKVATSIFHDVVNLKKAVLEKGNEIK